MVLGDVEIIMNSDNNIICRRNGDEFVVEPSHTLYEGYKALLEALSGEEEPSKEAEPTLTNEEILKRGISNLIKFFKDFEFEPNFRFVNTLAHKLAESKEVAISYVTNYFKLTDSQYKNEINSKCGSKEFEGILNDIALYPTPEKKVNTRLKIYYGSAGTGKTTLAMNETSNRCVVCNASMLPSDLMEDFAFDEGNPSFHHSALRYCIENGLPIVLDEINLLPFESLRFLQGILDGKSEFNYKDNIIKIREGFSVIGTMNLSLGGMVYGLPEPLVDRCMDIKEFKLTAENLMGSIVG